jgi:uncharacterized protein (DUF433 family)
MMTDRSACAAVESTPGKLGGEWVFKGTRVPIRAPFENLDGGASVDEFLEWFEGVEREQVNAVLAHVRGEEC